MKSKDQQLLEEAYKGIINEEHSMNRQEKLDLLTQDAGPEELSNILQKLVNGMSEESFDRFFKLYQKLKDQG